MTRGFKRVGLIALAFLGMAAVALSQRGRFFSQNSEPETEFPEFGEFHFLRVEYSDDRGNGFGFGSRRGRASGWWAQDWPDTEEHFTKGVQRLTRANVGAPAHMRLTDPEIYNYPWIYATQTGYWNLSNAETDALRDFLLRGGFLMTDDFWEQQEWEVFAETMNRVFPGQPITDIDLLVAATALEYDFTLLTYNRRHFDRIPDLRVYDSG